MRALGPVFIGGSNGSGTRVYARLFEAAGVFQGVPKNYAFEPEAIIPFTRPEVPKLMASTGGATYDLNSIPVDLRASAISWLKDFADTLRQASPPGCTRWGWKHPRNLFLTPLLNHLFPDAVFVHVVRDGRDMALAPNKGDFMALRKVLAPVFNADEQGAAAFWSQVNLEVWRWGSARFGPRYILSKFEDICSDPQVEGARILHAAGLQPTGATMRILAEISRPDTSGRWQTLSDEKREEVQDAALPGLRQFGYL